MISFFGIGVPAAMFGVLLILAVQTRSISWPLVYTCFGVSILTLVWVIFTWLQK